jgi:hypothetical protein
MLVNATCGGSLDAPCGGNECTLLLSSMFFIFHFYVHWEAKYYYVCTLLLYIEKKGGFSGTFAKFENARQCFTCGGYIAAGPVGIGDGLGATDRTIVLPSCDGRGWLLQPDKPMTAVDTTFSSPGQDLRGAPGGMCKSSWMSAADGGAVWSSVTQISYEDRTSDTAGAPSTAPSSAADTLASGGGGGARGGAAGAGAPSATTDTHTLTPHAAAGTYTTHFVLGINVTRPWELQRSDVWPRASASQTYLSRAWAPPINTEPISMGAKLRRYSSVPPCVNGTAAVASGCVSAAAPGGRPLPSLQSFPAAASGAYAIGESPFVLLAVHGVLSNGWVLWEDGKYVSVSKRRFRHMIVSNASIALTISGSPGEIVHLVALRPHTPPPHPPSSHASAPHDVPPLSSAPTQAEEWTVVRADVLIGKDAVETVTFN